MIGRSRRRRNGTHDGWDSHHGQMLLEDVQLGVMPIGGRASHAQGFVVQVAAGSTASEEAILGTLSEQPHYARDLAQVVSDWVPQCAVAILMYGQAEYELIVREGLDSVLVRMSAPDDRRPPDDARFAVKGRVISTLPEADAREMTALRRVLSAIADPFAVGRFFGYLDEGEKRNVAFEYDVFRREEAHALARATAFLGWNARGTFHPEHGQNAYYFVYRELKFHGFKAMLRDRAVECLNQCLRLAGEEGGQTMGVDVAGLPSQTDVAQAIADLEEGQTSFAALLDRFKI